MKNSKYRRQVIERELAKVAVGRAGADGVKGARKGGMRSQAKE